MHIRFITIAATAALLGACASDEPAGPGAEFDEGVHFAQTSGVAHSASGSPSGSNGSLLNAEFAVAREDSVGGIVIMSYDASAGGAGNLLVLQAPRQATTFECAIHGTECHGRVISLITTEDGSIGAARYYHLSSGNLTMTEVGPERLRGTFAGTFTANDDEAPASFTAEATINVPYIAYSPDDPFGGSYACLLAMIGVGNTTCPR